MPLALAAASPASAAAPPGEPSDKGAATLPGGVILRGASEAGLRRWRFEPGSVSDTGRNITWAPQSHPLTQIHRCLVLIDHESSANKNE